MECRIYISEDNKFKLSITSDCIETAMRYCDDSPNRETGGILIGQYQDNHSLASIKFITGPPKDSKRTRFNFERGKAGLQKLLDDNWEIGNYYLGEWHFHPGASPNPSRQDIKQMNEIARSQRYNCPEPILLIIGGRPSDYSVAIFISNEGGEFVRLYEL